LSFLVVTQNFVTLFTDLVIGRIWIFRCSSFWCSGR